MTTTSEGNESERGTGIRGARLRRACLPRGQAWLLFGLVRSPSSRLPLFFQLVDYADRKYDEDVDLAEFST